MIYKKYGKSDTEVSTLGFGGMRFADPSDIDKMAEIVVHAHNKGITYFDTAPGYCDDQSELIMGAAFKEMRKSGNPFVVSTKSSKSNGSELRKQLETSLKRFDMESLDFFNCWYVLTKEDWESRKVNGAVAAILKAKEEGLIKHAVFSTHLPGNQIAEVIEEGYFEGVTLGYSAINFPYREEGITAAAENGLGVVIMNPLGGGMIPQSKGSFDFLKVRDGQSVVDGALQFLYTDPRITTTLVGFSSKEDVDGAIASVDSFTPYSEAEIDQVKSGVSGELNALCTSCKYCKDCPVDIPVWAFVEASNHLIMKGGEGMYERLKYYWGVDPSLIDTCIDCGQCEAACTQKLPIMKRFEMVRKALAEEKAARSNK
ncbi:MAG: aldo/keto reductase [Spirochaetales bacterium]|nr:aldo/keto reductase [Spirochaetales bacterium]